MQRLRALQLDVICPPSGELSITASSPDSVDSIPRLNRIYYVIIALCYDIRALTPCNCQAQLTYFLRIFIFVCLCLYYPTLYCVNKKFDINTKDREDGAWILLSLMLQYECTRVMSIHIKSIDCNVALADDCVKSFKPMRRSNHWASVCRLICLLHCHSTTFSLFYFLPFTVQFPSTVTQLLSHCFLLVNVCTVC